MKELESVMKIELLCILERELDKQVATKGKVFKGVEWCVEERIKKTSELINLISNKRIYIED